MSEPDDVQPAAQSAPSAERPPRAVDLEELARKIYELLRRELQLENERTGR